jgi:hypothetical protein
LLDTIIAMNVSFTLTKIIVVKMRGRYMEEEGVVGLSKP